MKIQNVAYAIREISAIVVIAALFPLMIYQGINLFVKTQEDKIKIDTLKRNVEQEKRNLEQLVNKLKKFQIIDIEPDQIAAAIDRFTEQLKRIMQYVESIEKKPKKSPELEALNINIGKAKSHLKTAAKKLHKEQKEQDFIYSRKFFYISLLIGLFILILGLLIKVPSLGAGFVFGGGSTIVMAYAMRWRFLNELFLFTSLLLAILAITLGLLIYSRRKE